MEDSKWQKNAARKGILEDPLSWQPGEHLYKICAGYMLVRQAAAQGICPVLGKEHVEKAREGTCQGGARLFWELQGRLESAELEAVGKECGHRTKRGGQAALEGY